MIFFAKKIIIFIKFHRLKIIKTKFAQNAKKRLLKIKMQHFFYFVLNALNSNVNHVMQLLYFNNTENYNYI